jgi:hypothetical protein
VGIKLTIFNHSTSKKTEKVLSKRSPASAKDFESEPGSIPVGDCGDRNSMGPACCRALADLFLPATAVRYLVGIPVGVRSNRRLKLLQTQLVMRPGNCRPGAPRFALAGFARRSRTKLRRKFSITC